MTIEINRATGGYLQVNGAGTFNRLNIIVRYSQGVAFKIWMDMCDNCNVLIQHTTLVQGTSKAEGLWQGFGRPFKPFRLAGGGGT